MSQSSIRKLYEARLDAWGNAKGIRVAHQNEGFEPSPGVTYVECFLLPGRADSDFLDGTDRVFPGAFQISVGVPLGAGTGDGSALADELVALFPNNLLLTSGSLKVQQIGPASEAQGIPGDTHFTIPVSFQYRGDVTP